MGIVHRVKAKYDAAQRTDENWKHWQYADSLGPREANSLAVRRVLRERARYERDNNSYCLGMTSTLSGDLIGTGPRLQLLTDNDEANSFFEKAFSNWAECIDLAGKLQLMDMSAIVDGESFALFVDNPQLYSVTEVTMDIRPIECDLVTDERGSLNRWGMSSTSTSAASVDGIEFDKFGNPSRYRVLREHPGDAAMWGVEADWLEASKVLHWFRPLRAGQARGIPEITPALPLFSQLRRYTLAVLMAAEIAAEIAAFIQTELPPDGNGAESIESMELLEIVRGQITTLPYGWEIGQLDPAQPTTEYGDFVDRIIKEIARCLDLPFAIAAGDSSSYNYASGRLDVQGYQRKINRRRKALEVRNLHRVWRTFMNEAVTVKAYRPAFAGMPPFIQWPYQWIWPGFEHVDPSKEAAALETLLANNATTLADWYAAKGKDWEEQIRQRAKETALLEELGLDAAPPAPNSPSGGPPVDDVPVGPDGEPLDDEEDI